ncbi:hypothetical protein [Brachyspira hampsonii]|uniref:hypothetical protein n=1 Tax=Brachyspira hampsonii TaxID=1287055 RepID=UPI000D339F39|nr:hypothetical protein [Brachyspira hampsonii]PTY40844.1 hypothetical protein DQ06_09890 [Brachyspira hampsonii bv. II]
MNLTNQEQNYYELIVDMLDDGIIDDSERSLLNKKKDRYGLSDARAKEIEDFALNEIQSKNKPKFNTEDEEEYYELLEDMLEDGIIDESERSLLNKRKDKYGISDERAKEFEDYIKGINNGNSNSSLEQINSIENDIDKSDIVNNIKKDNNISDENDLKISKNSKEIINQESKNIKEENDDPKKVIENKEEDIEEFDAEVLAYKKRKKKRGNVSIFDRVEYYAKVKRPLWLKLWIWAVILGLEIYFAHSLQYVHETDSLFAKVVNKGVNFLYDSGFNLFDKVSGGAASDFMLMITIAVNVIILFILYIIFHMLLTYLPSFISVTSNMGKREIKKGLHLGTILISIALIVFSFLFVRDNNKELNELRKNINNSLRNDNYSQAVAYIKSAKKIETISEENINNMYNNVSHNIINEIERLYKKDMNKKNYDSIIEKINAYNKLDNNYQKIDGFDIDFYTKNIDIKRDEYLTKLIDKIYNMSPNEARIKLNEVYHNSNREKDRKNVIGWVPIIGKISYKSYWDDVREKYLKELNKN